MTTSDEMRRLAFIKTLYRSGVEQSHRPGDLAAASVLTFHDAVELFLQLAAEHLNESTRGIQFEQYWDKLELHLNGRRLAERESLRRLNKLRVNLKHDGTFPSALSIEGFRGSVTSFFEVNTPLLFDGLEFSGISMVQVVLSEWAKTHLNEAEKKATANELAAALTEVSVAFTILLDENDRKMRARYGRSPYWFGGHLPIGDSGPEGLPRTELQSVREEVYQAMSEVRTLQRTIRVLTLGLDYRRYARFSLIAPYVQFLGLPGGIDGYIGELSPEVAEKATMDDYRFCFDFVIDSALQLQEFAFDPK